MSEVFDVVCVGSGISALAYAASFLATHPGARLVLLEKHRLVGGYATHFLRSKQQSAFDVSLHKLTGMGANGNLREMLKRLDVFDSLEWVYPESLFDARFTESNLLLPRDADALEDVLKARFPDCKEGVERLFNDVRSYGLDSYMQFRTMAGEYEPDIKRLRYAHAHLKTMSVKDAIAGVISDPALRELLSVPCAYTGSFPEQTSYLYFLHVWYAALFAESAYMRGGSSSLTAALVARIEALGGVIKTRAEVLKILIDEESMMARGVVTERGVVLAKQVVVNAAPSYAVDELIENGLPGIDEVRAAFAAKQSAASTTTVYLVFDVAPESLGLGAAETMLVARDPAQGERSREAARAHPTSADMGERAYWHDSTIEVTNYHALDPEGGCVVVVNALDIVHHWPARKTDAYRDKKLRAQRCLMQRLFTAFPAMAEHVRYAEVSSPRTYQRYTNNTNGSGYGALVAPANQKTARTQRLPVNNIRFISQWTSGGGYEATIGYAAMLGFQKTEETLI